LKKFLHKFLLVINYLVIFLLLLSYLSVYISPESFWPLAFLGLAYPVLIILIFIFIVYWLIRKKIKYLLISFLAVVIGWTHLSNTIQISGRSMDAGADSLPVIKTMSYNVRVFDLYNWAGNKESHNRIFDFIVDESADIICFQEFYFDEKGEFSTIDTLVKIQKAKNYHIKYTEHAADRYHFGAATFSAFPVINRGDVHLEETNNICMFTDLDLGYDTIRIYNCHLESIRFQPANYEFLDSIKLKFEEKQINEARDIMRKMKNAYIKRAGQAELIAEHISNSPYPVIVCGDFNDTHMSYAYHRISKNLEDAFVESGSGTGNTYTGKFPSFRIDFILHGKDMKSYDYTTTKIRYSDHYPLTCIFTIPDRE